MNLPPHAQHTLKLLALVTEEIQELTREKEVLQQQFKQLTNMTYDTYMMVQRISRVSATIYNFPTKEKS